MRFGFLVFDGYSNMVLASAIEPLRAARDIAGPDSFSWQLISMSGGAVASSSGLTLLCDARLSEARDLDALFVVAGYGARNHATTSTTKALQLAARRIATIGGLDGGAWLLAGAGLLRGRRATLHWQDAEQFTETQLDIEVTRERFVIDGNRITAGHAATVTELMLRLIEDRRGGALAFDVSNLFSYEGGQARERAANGQSSPRRDPVLVSIVEVMRSNLERPLALRAMAARASVSPRSLARLFQSHFGASPGAYYRRLRLEAARTLAEETTLSVAEIAERTGFSSSACLSRSFKAQFGNGPREIRKSGRRGAPRIANGVRAF